MIGNTHAKTKPRIAFFCFCTTAIIPKTKAAGPNNTGKRNSDTVAKMIAKLAMTGFDVALGSIVEILGFEGISADPHCAQNCDAETSFL